MFDWVNALVAEATITLKSLVTLIAVIGFIVTSHKGDWALSRIITAAIVAALVIAATWGMGDIAHKFETEFK